MPFLDAFESASTGPATLYRLSLRGGLKRRENKTPSRDFYGCYTYIWIL